MRTIFAPRSALLLLLFSSVLLIVDDDEGMINLINRKKETDKVDEIRLFHRLTACVKENVFMLLYGQD